MDDKPVPPPVASLRGDFVTTPSGTTVEPDNALPLPTYTLFSPGQIGAVTFLGGPAGAGVLFWSNFKNLGQTGKATAALVLGVVATVAVCLLGMHLPASFPRSVLPVAYTIAVSQYAKATLSGPFDYHRALQGRRASNWAAVGIALASLVVTLGAVFGIVMMQLPSKLEFGPCEVYYDAGGTKAEAQKLGDELVKIEYFSKDHGATVTVKRAAGRHVVAFVLNDTALTEQKFADGFRQIAPDLSMVVFDGEPVDIWLNDDHDRTKVRLMWETTSPPAVTP